MRPASFPRKASAASIRTCDGPFLSAALGTSVAEDETIDPPVDVDPQRRLTSDLRMRARAALSA